jgi:hypothetical protein
MIATQRHEFSLPLVGDEPIEDRARIGPAVDVIAERDEGILWLERYERR